MGMIIMYRWNELKEQSLNFTSATACFSSLCWNKTESQVISQLMTTPVSVRVSRWRHRWFSSMNRLIEDDIVLADIFSCWKSHWIATLGPGIHLDIDLASHRQCCRTSKFPWLQNYLWRIMGLYPWQYTREWLGENDKESKALTWPIQFSIHVREL